MPPTPIQRRARLTVALFVLLISGLVTAQATFFPVAPLQAQETDTYLPIVGGGPNSSTPVATSTRTPEPVTTATPEPDAPALSSLALIHEAEVTGAITHEEALLYSVYALYADDRLPAQFDGAANHDSMVMGQIRDEWQSLTPATQQALAPYLLPPTAAGSWHELRTASSAEGTAAIVWKSVTSSNNVRIWYQTRYAGDATKATQVRDAIDERIYTVLHHVMGKGWLPDGGHANNGGSSMLDIYLVRDVDYYGLATSYIGCEQTPAWINLDSDRAIGDELTDGMIQTAAHEMMHAVQFAYSLKEECSSYNWLAESTAKWFEHQVYPQANSEHVFVSSYLDTAYWPLERTNYDRQYGAYLYFFYVSETTGDPSIVRRAWENVATMDSLSAVDQGGASFSTYWGEFAVANWNPNAESFYQEYDDLVERAKPYSDITPVDPGDGLEILALPMHLDHLSMQYFVYQFPDDTARSITFVNGITAEMSPQPDLLYADDKYYQGELLPLEKRRNIEVHALFRIAGDPEWKHADWTLEKQVAFCRDTIAERLEELVIVVANGESDNKSPSYTFEAPGEGAALVVSDTGCWRWKGSLAVTSADGSWDEYLVDVPEILLQSSDDWANAYRRFDVISGHGTIAFSSQNDEGCDGEETFTEGAQHFTILPESVSEWSMLRLPVAVTDGQRVRALAAEIVSDATYGYVWLCETDDEHPGRERHELGAQIGPLLRLPSLLEDDFKTFEDGGVLEGSAVVDGFRYTYHLEAQRESRP